MKYLIFILLIFLVGCSNTVILYGNNNTEYKLNKNKLPEEIKYCVLQTTDDKKVTFNTCLIDYAIENNKSDLCKYTVDEIGNARCMITINPSLELSFCEQYKGEGYSFCINRLNKINTMNANYAMIDLAIQTKNSSICKGTQIGVVDACIIRVAVTNNDITLCDKVQNETKKSKCINKIIQNINDTFKLV